MFFDILILCSVRLTARTGGFQPFVKFENFADIYLKIDIMERKICSKCELEKEVSEFTKNKRKKDGYNSYCKECNKTYQQGHYQRNKGYYFDKKKEQKETLREYVENIKKTAKCLRCPEDDMACLDFHHTGDKTKDFNIGKAISNGVSIETLQKEIDKCIILCSNCHRKLHYYED